jgi:hypothetical protein
LKAAVEQIEVIINAFESASVAVLESPWPDSEMQADIVSRFVNLLESGSIPENLRPKSWNAFGANVLTLVKSYQRNPAAQPAGVEQILRFIESDLTDASRVPLPVSGTLFQYVVSIVARPDGPGNIDRFTIVPSRELVEFYGVTAIPRPFVFDGTAEETIPAEEPEQSEEVTEAAEVADDPGAGK